MLIIPKYIKVYAYVHKFVYEYMFAYTDTHTQKKKTHTNIYGYPQQAQQFSQSFGIMYLTDGWRALPTYLMQM